MARISAVGLLLALLLSLSPPLADAEELLANGGFETGTIDPWRHTGGTTLAVVTNPTNGGQYAAKFETTADPVPQEVYQNVFPIVGGASYIFSAYLAAGVPTAVGELRLRLSCYESADATGVDLCQADYLVPSLAVTFSFATTGPRNVDIAARSARVRIRVTPAGGAPAVVYLDDLSFQGPPPPLSTPTPTPTPLPTPTPAAPPSETTPTSIPAPTPTPLPSEATPGPEPIVFPTLTNGGFEVGRADGTPYAWRHFGGLAARTTSFTAEGDHAAAFSSTTGSTKWMYQVVSVAGGSYYEFTARARRDDPNVESVFLSVLWYASSDGSGSNIGNDESTTRLTVDSTEFRPLTTGPVPAPANARSARLRLMLRPRSEATATVHFDAVTFAEAAPPLANVGAAGEGLSDQPLSGSDGRSPLARGSAPSPTPAVLARGATPVPLANVGSPTGKTPKQQEPGGGLGRQAELALILGLGLGLPLAGTSAWLAYAWWSRPRPQP